jgi:ABC-type ATPase with predicted acetyltransferase domain
MFDLEERETEPVPSSAASARAIDAALGPGQLALVTGPSGGGKSTILREVRKILRERGNAATVVNPERLAPGRVVDALDASLETTLVLLSSCGLADATILERRTGELSAGQRWRLALAVSMRRAQRRGPHATLLVDEFCSTLDRTAAACLCRTLRRWVRVRSIRAVCATHDDSLMEYLAPSVLAVQPLNGVARVQVRA